MARMVLPSLCMILNIVVVAKIIQFSPAEGSEDPDCEPGKCYRCTQKQASNRSRKPPWPGKMLPESFIWRFGLSRLSTRSPPVPTQLPTGNPSTSQTNSGWFLIKMVKNGCTNQGIYDHPANETFPGLGRRNSWKKPVPSQ